MSEVSGRPECLSPPSHRHVLTRYQARFLSRPLDGVAGPAQRPMVVPRQLGRQRDDLREVSADDASAIASPSARSLPGAAEALDPN